MLDCACVQDSDQDKNVDLDQIVKVTETMLGG